MGVADDMRLALFGTQPQILKFAAQIQGQPSQSMLNADKDTQYNLVFIFIINLEKSMMGWWYVKKTSNGVAKQKRLGTTG